MGVKGARLEDVRYELSQTVKIDDIPIICHVLTQIYRTIQYLTIEYAYPS